MLPSKTGADAVGMSTVLEVIQARALGLEVVAFSCLTNLAAGISKEKLSHDEVLETGRAKLRATVASGIVDLTRTSSAAASGCAGSGGLNGVNHVETGPYDGSPLAAAHG